MKSEATTPEPEMTADGYTQMPEGDRRNSGLIVLMLFAQAYYKMLESVVSMADWVSAIDLELNASYISIVKNLENILKNHPDLADFPETFEPLFPDLYPSTVADSEWDDMVRPHAERFLSTVQQYVHSNGVYEPENGSAGWVFVELVRGDVTTAIERAAAYEKRMRDHWRKLLPPPAVTRARWDETWHRLREWTNGQAPSERLAAQILLSEGYRDLDPSHPLGGPDGGMDASCTKDGESWIMAVYFPRGQQTFTTIKRKFLDDLDGVAKNGAAGFAFVTNQELSKAERAELRRCAVPVPVDLYHLERITAILDKPDMASVRQQFLLIE